MLPIAHILKNYFLSSYYTGSNPVGSLILASNGKFYGMTSAGGVNSVGALFQYDTTNLFIKRFDFATNDGYQPLGSLVQASNGNLYGVTRYGGTNNMGVLFEFNPTTNTYTKKLTLMDLLMAQTLVDLCFRQVTVSFME